MIKSDEFQCSCCQAKAKFTVNENYACARHLAYLVIAHTVGKVPPKVEVIRKNKL